METMILQILEGLLFILFNFLILGFILVVKRFLTEKQQETLKAIAEDAVLFAQQIGQAMGSDEKLKTAKDFAVSELNKLGIKITIEQLEVIIEATLLRLKLKYGENWKK